MQRLKEFLNKIKAHYTKFFYKKEWYKLEYNYYDKVDNVISIIKENFDQVDYYIKKEQYKTFILFRNEEDLTYIKLIQEKKEPQIPFSGNVSISGGTVFAGTSNIQILNSALGGTQVYCGTVQLSQYPIQFNGTCYTSPNNPSVNSPLQGIIPFWPDDL